MKIARYTFAKLFSVLCYLKRAILHAINSVSLEGLVSPKLLLPANSSIGLITKPFNLLAFNKIAMVNLLKKLVKACKMDLFTTSKLAVILPVFFLFVMLPSTQVFAANCPIGISISPASDTVSTATGCSITLTATITVTTGSVSNGAITYTWYSNTVNSTSGGTVVQTTNTNAGNTSSTYSPPTSSTGTFYYYCTVSPNSGSCSTSYTTPVEVVQVGTSVYNVPYHEDFDDQPSNQNANDWVTTMPCGWTIIDVNNDGYTWVNAGLEFNTFPNSLTYFYDYNSSANDWAISPGLSLIGGVTYTLTFNYASSVYYPERLAVYYGNSNTVAAQTHLINNIGTIQNDNYTAATYTFTPASSGTYYLGFYCYSLTNEDFLTIDDIVVNGPSCTPPTTGATSFSTNTFTATSMNYAFTRGNGNDVMVIAKAGSAPSAPTNSTTYTASATYGSGTPVGGGYCVYNGTAAGINTATGNIALTGLTCGTPYYFAVYEYNTASTCYQTTGLTGTGTTTCTTAPVAASTPSPATSATGVANNVSLSWAASACAVSYNIYFGTSSPGTYIGNQTGTSYTPSGMSYSTTYYWRVDAVNTCGTTTGTVWSFTTTTPSYCMPSSSSSSTYINSFSTTGGLSNITNNGSGYSSGGYGNFTADVVSQYPNNPINWSLTMAGGTAGIGIWVDWNNDGVFTDAGDQEYLTTTYQSSGTYTGSFSVPSGASIGTHRMRVLTDYEAQSPNPCTINAAGPRGEAEDYTFTVVTACSAPTAVSLSGFANPVCIGYSPGTFTATPTGGSPATYSYQWYNTNGIISGATGSTYTAGNLAANTGYYCTVSTGTGCSLSSSTQTITVNIPAVTNTAPTGLTPTGATFNGTD